MPGALGRGSDGAGCRPRGGRRVSPEVVLGGWVATGSTKTVVQDVLGKDRLGDASVWHFWASPECRGCTVSFLTRLAQKAGHDVALGPRVVAARQLDHGF